MSVSSKALDKWFESNGHKHFCSDRDCRRVYQCLDVIYMHRCAEPRRNKLCGPCKGGALPVYSWGEAAPCCANNVRQVTSRDELKSYRLGGAGPWFLCKKCARVGGWPTGINPNKKENSHG